MRLIDYLKDKLLVIIFFLMSICIITLVLLLLNTNYVIIFYILTIFIINNLVFILHDYIKKKNFYNNFQKTLNKLDKKYLITEMITTSNFLEGEILLNYLDEINKDMHEEINNYKYRSNEFREYLELWCHEIKTPIATTKLILENNKTKINGYIQEELEKIETYVEQVLYYAKSDVLEHDYIITNTNLKEVVEKTIKRNKKDFINKKIKINLKLNDSINVKSDSKWLEFIINQIIINSIKYSKESDSLIKIEHQENRDNTLLIIKDNGIGIPSSDIENVFEKGFTGSNGHKKYRSTGLGLFLCKKLCDKLGHVIYIDSKEGEYTKVTIVFPKSSMTSII